MWYKIDVTLTRNVFKQMFHPCLDEILYIMFTTFCLEISQTICVIIEADKTFRRALQYHKYKSEIYKTNCSKYGFG